MYSVPIQVRPVDHARVDWREGSSGKVDINSGQVYCLAGETNSPLRKIAVVSGDTQRCRHDDVYTD